MAKVPSGPRPPNHSPLLREYVYHIVACHEAAHAVAAYMYRIPHFGATVGKFKNFRMQGPHLHRDVDAIDLAEGAVIGRGLPTNMFHEAEFVCCGIAGHVNIVANAVPEHEAKFYASDDLDFLEEIIRTNGFDAATERHIRKNARHRRVELTKNLFFQKAVEVVAEALKKRVGFLSESEMSQLIEGAVGDKLKNGALEPTHEEIELAAYYLHEKRGEKFDSLANWLCAERALRYEKASTIIP